MSTAIDFSRLETAGDNLNPKLDWVFDVSIDTDKEVYIGTDQLTSTAQSDVTRRSARLHEKKYSPRKKELIKEDIIQKWNGIIECIDGVDVTAVIKDQTDTSQPDERIILDINEFDPRECDLIKPGAMFYWYIGYRQGRTLSKQRISVIRLRRLPNWNEIELKRAELKAQQMVEFFNDNSKNSTT